MNGELKKMVDQIKALWNKLPARSRILVMVLAVGIIGGAAALGLRGPTESWSVLFSGLASEDSAKVVEQLKADNTPYRITGADTIEVPSAKVHELRLALAGAGLPRGGGVGFELFDKQQFGTTSFVEQMNYRRALQGELARTIMSLDAVERARVHIAAPEKSLYKDDDDAPTASVVLQLKPEHKLSSAQVRGIVHLVAGSISGLKAERVTVVDEQGTPLWSGDDNGAGVDASADLERVLTKRVREIVERVVGNGHAQVEVTAELDESRAERTEDIYDKDKTALRSESKSEEKGAAGAQTAGGVAGSQGNLPGAPNPSSGSGSSGDVRLNETRNYEVSHVVNRVVQPKARVKRIHVAVLVDEATDAKGAHKARSADELARIGALARTAAGLEDERGDKIEVAQAPFAANEPEKLGDEKPALKLPKWWPYAAGGAGGLFILMTFLALRRKKPLAPEIVHALPAPIEKLEAQLSAKPAPMAAELTAAASSRDRALNAARGDTTRAARVLSQWLGDEEQKSASK